MIIKYRLCLAAIAATACGNAGEASDAGVSIAAAGGSCVLSIARLGEGNGVVVSKPNGIACGDICSSSFACGTTITLSAVPADSTFVGWSNGCNGIDDCIFALAAATRIGAVFSVCGNGIAEIGERCDDGNTTD